MFQFRLSDITPERLIEYSKTAHLQLYLDESSLRQTINSLTNNIVNHAKQHSPVYKTHDSVITKTELNDKSKWYVDFPNSTIGLTGGSTSGRKFEYQRWQSIYFNIEALNHYRMIVDEFNLPHACKVLYLELDQSFDKTFDYLTKIYRTDNVVLSHGLGQQAEVHEVIINRMYYENYYKFYQSIIEYATQQEIDIITAPGNIISALVWNIKRLKHRSKICKLLSNTNEKLDLDDIEYLEKHHLIDHWCDHMRCWDGGVTFFTCAHGTYHLIDSLAYAWSDDEYRLISNDFFSYPSPFIKYWNGDYTRIGSEYQRCACGRLYRSFEFGRTRNFAVNTTNAADMQSIIHQIIDIVKRVETLEGFMRIVTTERVDKEMKALLRKQLSLFQINFIVEEPLDE